MVDQPLILAAASYYLPGYKGGGGPRTLINMVDHLGDEFQSKVLTTDRDFGETKPYDQVSPGFWQSVGKAKVLYLSPQERSLKVMRSLICATKHDVLYLNSFFSPAFTVKPLLLRRLGLIPASPVVLAPRGEFTPGALALKRVKKQAYMVLAKVLGLYRDVIWHASNEYEEEDIRSQFGNRVPVMTARDLTTAFLGTEERTPRGTKRPGCLRIVFLSNLAEEEPKWCPEDA